MPAPPPLTAAQDRLINAILDRVAVWAARSPTVTQISNAVVVAVAANGAADGNSLVTVAWRGADIQVPYLATYTPVVNHVVAVAKTGSHLLILGRVVGTP